MEPDAGGSPFPRNGGRRNAEHFRGVVDRETGEEAQFHDAALLFIEFGEILQRLVEYDDVEVGLLGKQ